MSIENYKEMYEELNRLHNSQNSAVKKMEEKIMSLYEEIKLKDEKLANAQKALDINKEIMRNALLEQNRVQQEYGAEITLLKDKIKDLEGKSKN